MNGWGTLVWWFMTSEYGGENFCQSFADRMVTRNLQDVFGESDAVRRRAAVNWIITEVCVFYGANAAAVMT